MDFVTGLPKSKKQNDSIFVVVDNLSKSTHLILVKLTHKKVHIVDNLFKGDIQIAWDTQGNNMRSRYKFYQKILEIFIIQIGDAVEI